MPPIRLILADDHRLFRQGLKALLEEESDVLVVGEAALAEEIHEMIRTVPCDLLILDLQMDRSVLADIEGLSQKVSVLVLSASEVTSDAVAAVRHGARGVVFKRFAVELLMEAIRTVAAGNVWLPPTLQTQVAAQLRSPSANRLTPREEEIVQCVARGQRNAEVAKNLSISEETVKTHLTRIFRKVGVRDRIELVLYAARMGVSAESDLHRQRDRSSTAEG